MTLEIRKVLVVDDEPDLRTLVASILHRHNLECAEAADGQQALDMLRSETFHAVLCDIMMPECSGLECLAQAQAYGIETPFVFVTGFGDSERMAQAVRLGAVDFITKPFDARELVDVVFRVLEVGVRRRNIKRQLASGGDLSDKILKEERMIGHLRALNNRKRTS